MSPLPKLTPPRQAMGVILIGDSVYTFCGRTGHKDSQKCAKFDIPLLTWKPLQDALRSRALFNPCEHSGLVYLLGGTDELAPGETYNLAKNTFAVTPMKWKESCVSIFVHSCLYVIGEQEALVMKPKKKSVTQPIRDSLWDHCWSAYAPLMYEGKLVILQRTRGRVVELDLESLEWVSFGFEGGKAPRYKMAPSVRRPATQPAPRRTHPLPQQPAGG